RSMISAVRATVHVSPVSTQVTSACAVLAPSVVPVNVNKTRTTGSLCGSPIPDGSSRLRKNRGERRTSSSSRRIERWMTAACAPVLSPPRVRPAEGGARSCGLLGQVPDADEIVDRCGKGEEPVHAARPAMPELAHQADGLEPAEDLL